MPTVAHLPARPPDRFSFSSTDAEEIEGFIAAMYAENRLRLKPTRAPVASYTATAADVPGLGGDSVHSSIGCSVDMQSADDFVATSVVGGQVAMDRPGRGAVVLRPGDSILQVPGLPERVDVDEMHVRVVRVPGEAMERVATEVAGDPGHRVRFHDTAPLSPPLASYWAAQVRFVTGALLAPDSPMSYPLIREEIARATALAALHVFPNTTMSDVHRPGPGRVDPASLRRAVSYIEAHAHEPLTLADIAAAAGTEARAVQYAFRRHRDITPLGYLRRVRLERAHQELQAADPTHGDTVAAVAARWGFANPGRFAATYHASYGVSPSHTLRH